ncbi:non-canonical purine NTP pyrophosphatase [Cytobacillus sp. IB215665]|uniref:non-canonical purine NTP pyrophosphatase n=1 Tax=Cytobacillus sp. IB215665 TaxID=3097357 RepID=UPI002A1075ED|nr:non-canonical purine NTP pyrophosphatase [Cytobacillus sp. IB215665]MDX8365599.1 non-canonical purine NTP pyrophosphatase [Cytobacillus sp. IB215665]
MNEIVFVTTNKGKIASAQKSLSKIKVMPFEAELIEPRSDDIREIAKQKVIQAYELVNTPCIAMDSGFFIKQLNGFPKAYVNHMLDTIGIEGILKLMEGESDRFCEFKSCVAFYDGEMMKYFESNSPGYVANAVRGQENKDKWSDLWYIFIPEKFNKTLAQFDEVDFNTYAINKESSLDKFGQWFMNKYSKIGLA